MIHKKVVKVVLITSLQERNIMDKYNNRKSNLINNDVNENYVYYFKQSTKSKGMGMLKKNLTKMGIIKFYINPLKFKFNSY